MHEVPQINKKKNQENEHKLGAMNSQKNKNPKGQKTW